MLGFLKDGDNQFSATRLAFLAWAIGVLGVWIGNNVPADKNSPFKLDAQVVYILGVLMAGKVGQSFAENKDDANTGGVAAGAAIGAAAGAGAAVGAAAGAMPVAPPNPNPQPGFTGEFKTPYGKTVSVKDGVVLAIS